MGKAASAEKILFRNFPERLKKRKIRRHRRGRISPGSLEYSDQIPVLIRLQFLILYLIRQTAPVSSATDT